MPSIPFSWPIKGVETKPLVLDENEVYGVDINVVAGLPRDFALARGLVNLANALVRRLTTPRGALRYDPLYGTDLRSYLNGALTKSQIAAVGGAVEAELLKDERVQSVSVALTSLPYEGKLVLRAVVTTGTGPFRMVVGISSLTAELLTLDSVAVG